MTDEQKLIIELLSEVLTAVTEPAEARDTPRRRWLLDAARLATGCPCRRASNLVNHRGTALLPVRYGLPDEGVKVYFEEEGTSWTGWVPYGDIRLFEAGHTEYVSTVWVEEATKWIPASE